MQRVVARVLRSIWPYLAAVFVVGLLPALAWAQAGQGPDIFANLPPQLQREEFRSLLEPTTVLRVVIDVIQSVLIVPVYLCWVMSTDWVNRDRHHYKFPISWNVAMFTPFAFFFLLSWLIPLWVVAYPLILLAYLVPFVSYVVWRNGQVTFSEKVFTARHLKQWFMTGNRKDGSGAPEPEEEGPPVKMNAQGAPSERDNNVNLLVARQAPGWIKAKELLAEAIDRRSEAIMLDYTAQNVGVKFQIDGIWHDAAPREREPGDQLLAVLKKLGNLNPEERRARQEGEIPVAYKDFKRQMRIAAAGVQTGERVVLQFDFRSESKKQRLTDLGIRPALYEQVKERLEQKAGLIIVSAPPRGGLSWLYHGTLGAMDRYIRAFVCIEDKIKPETDVENVPVKAFDSTAGSNAMSLLPNILREYPDVLVVPEIRDAELASFLLEQAREERPVVTTVRGKETAEALLRCLQQMGCPASDFAPAASVVLNVRLVRKLCDKCKQAYPPPPQLLQQLRIPPGRIEVLYKQFEPDPEKPQPPCKQCSGIGYFGRIGIIECMLVDDQIRAVLQAKPSVEAVRTAARKAGMKTLQEEGILHVLQGITSLPELMRVLKE